MDGLKKEIEDIDEEQVLVELARIEARKELEEIQTQREKEAKDFYSAMEDNKKKIHELVGDIETSKQVETKLAVTLSDVNWMQNELKLVKEMERKVKRSESSMKDERETSVTEELEAAKKELASIREESFQFMTSMDIIRNELKHVKEETSRLKKREQKAESNVQNLNSKMLRAKAKLESVSAGEEKAKSIVSNLSTSLEQLKKEAEAAKKEKEQIKVETATIKEEIQNAESEIVVNEEKLQDAMQELEAVKSSEALAFENLKSLVDSAMKTRASASQHSSLITISKLEYEYLTGRAVVAKEIADKKVAAAEAWIEALSPSRRGKFQKSASPAPRGTMNRSTSIAIRKKRKVVPKLSNFFRGKNAEKDE